MWLAACGSSGGHGAPVDGPPAIDAFYSACGHPGDTGNSLGVGKFCTTLQDCADNSQATICSTLGNDPSTPQLDSYFCTALCSASSPPGFCGDGASCMCGSAGCGCAPSTCSAP
ncbi:MAG TPA: hypothetical protein VLX92_29850 [Kofleriaceae bacterium]|nr:hypothetical protein [Kofleriaceae bacterium]